MSLHRDPSVEVLASEPVFRGKIFDVVRETARLPSGLVQDLAVVVHPGAVAIAAEDEKGELVLVRQYRHALGRRLLELPAGRLERGEAPIAAAKRELEEETGLSAREWKDLGAIVPAPGFCSETIWIFHARGLATVADKKAQDADEELDVERATIDALLAGGTDDAKTLVACAWILSARARDRRAT